MEKSKWDYLAVNPRTAPMISREPNVSEGLYQELISFVSSAGFDISKIIKVVQTYREGTEYEN
ncbi:MAG: hypothetical protein JJE17_05530 [Peptostreptococcaceae bacterium]|nr:hypothetical protein [Peptostreptococcaceae bacterium]HZK61088.1 hypothetical protein [Anaerovoracaceae bacterium]